MLKRELFSYNAAKLTTIVKNAETKTLIRVGK